MKRSAPGLAAALGLALALAAPARAADPFLRHTATADAVQKSGPAVVNVTTERLVPARSPFGSFGDDPCFDRFFQDFFEPRVPQTARSLGSGVLVDAEHHVLTNEHVVARPSRTRVSLADERELDARLVAADPNDDLAVLRVESQEKLPWVPPGTSGGPLLSAEGRLGGVLEHVTVGQAVRVELLQGGTARSVTAVARELEPAAVAELTEQLLGLRLQRAVLGRRGLPRALLVVQRGNGRYHVPIPLS